MINPTKSPLDHPQLTKATVINPTKNPDQTQMNWRRGSEVDQRLGSSTKWGDWWVGDIELWWAVTLRIESGRWWWDKEVRVWESELERVLRKGETERWELERMSWEWVWERHNWENKRIKKNKQTYIILIWLRIKNYYYYLALSYSAQPYIVVHCNNEGKNFTVNSTTVIWNFVFWWS